MPAPGLPGRKPMGARDWMLVYAEREVQPVLASAPVLDREAKVH
jgi:hypothetical protein